MESCPMNEPQPLTALTPRSIPDCADMAIAVQANLVQLKVALSKRAEWEPAAHDIDVGPPGAVSRYRETLIPRDALASYDFGTLSLRIHQVWGQHCLFCWFFHIQDVQHPPDFRRLRPGSEVRCPTVLAQKTLEIEKMLWRLRFEQRFRSDPEFKDEPNFEAQYQAAQEIPALVMGENVRVCSMQHLVLGACEYAGMLAAARWIGDSRWSWAQDGIMDLPG